MEEFKNRKEYEDPTGSLDYAHCADRQVHDKAVQSAAPKTANTHTDWDGVHLFATKTCTNCKLAKQALDEAGAICDVVYAEDAPELASSLGIRTAPNFGGCARR